MPIRTVLVAAMYFVFLASTASAVQKSWQGGASGFWNEFLSWSPLGAPQAGDDVFITDLPALGEDAKTLLDADYTIHELTLKHGGDADTNGHLLELTGGVLIGGADANGSSAPRLTVSQHAAGASTTALQTALIFVEADGEVVVDGARIVVAWPGNLTGSIEIDEGSSFSGYGVLQFQDALSALFLQFSNSGTLSTSRPSGAVPTDRYVLTVQSSEPNSSIANISDLGSTLDIVSMTTLDMDVRVSSSFRGEVLLAPGAVIDTTDSTTPTNQLFFQHTSRLVINAGTNTPGVPSTATFRGPRVILTEESIANINSGVLVLEQGLNTETSSSINIAANSGLQIDPYEGVISEINGELNINGAGASLVLNDFLHINDPVFDWDGAGENAVTTINPGGSLTINADDVSPGLSDTAFDGTININGGNLTASVTSSWTLAGELNINDGGVLRDSQVGLLTIEGTINANNGVSRLWADSIYASGSTTNIQAFEDTLENAGETRIEAGALFNGSGLLSNANNSELTVADGANVQVPTQNRGDLHLENGAGQATVFSYDQGDLADLFVELGGSNSAAYDRLIVIDTASIDGMLNVSLINGFAPSAGQSFTILDAATRIGQFDNGPGTLPALPGDLFWEIEYTSSSVILNVLSSLSADADNDGDVDGADFLLIQRNNPSLIPQWQAEYGAAPSQAASRVVPEPSSTLLLLAALLLHTTSGGERWARYRSLDAK